jgi:hypothetical protein
MLSLSALASWESVILASIEGASGTIDDRDAQITRSGLYAEYPAIFATYLELAQLADDPATALEALKRAVFVAWLAFTAPSVFTGIAELPELQVRELMHTLNSAIVDGRVDDELRWMLVFYNAEFGYVFEHFGPVRALDELIAGRSLDDVYANRGDKARFEGRGQMGRYWMRVVG